MGAGGAITTGRLTAFAALTIGLLAAAAVALSPPAELRRTPTAPAATLTPVAFADLPGWAEDDPAGALAAFRASCPGIVADPGRFSPVFGAAADWARVCAAAADTLPAGARAFFETRFEAFAVSGPDGATGLVTGYYEPELDGSRTWSMVFPEPAYPAPADLVTVDAAAFAALLNGQRLAGKVVGARLVPYDTRGQIGAYTYGRRNRPLLYLRSQADGFFLQIQGSGRVRLTDGTLVRLGYAAQNGHPYTAIGGELIARGEIAREDMSMAAIRAWLAANPLEAEALMNRNASYVFFAESPLDDPSTGPKGAEGVALTPGRSLAVDARVWPYGLPVFVAGRIAAADGIGEEDMARLMVAQDTGGAIRGVVRGDIFFGWGAEAERRAGGTDGAARFYVLLPRPPEAVPSVPEPLSVAPRP